MAKRRRRRRRRRSRLVPVLVALLLIIVVGAVGVITSYVKKYTPSDTRMDLKDYYAQEAQDDVTLVLQDTISETKGKAADGKVYLPYSLVSGSLGGRFYWDQESQNMLYTTPEGTVKIPPESSSYENKGQQESMDYVIVRQIDGEYYIALDFLEKYMQIKAETYENPWRTVISYKWGDVNTTEAKTNTLIRYQGGIKSPILREISKGESMILLEKMDNWSRVMTADGIDGYIENKDLGAVSETEYVYDGEYQEEYAGLTRDHKISLVWHQVTSEAANAAFESAVKDVKGVNVVSPTWFSVVSAQGNISSLASADYVSKAHSKGMEVWGLIDNFDKNVSTLEVLSSQSSREHIIEKLIQEAKRVGMDGINVDFEALSEEEAPHFIQFIREICAACRANDLLLSVDDPVPQFTGFYNRKEQGIMADYVIIMGYDEHTTGSEEAGSVASLPFVEEGIVKTLQEVPKEKVINGVPFYTRLWTEANNGMVSSEVFGMDEAEQYAKDKGMDVYWNTEVSQNYGEISTETGTEKIWFEDEKSLEEKMKLVDKYQLAGAAAWKLGFERAGVWDIFSNYIQ